MLTKVPDPTLFSILYTKNSNYGMRKTTKQVMNIMIEVLHSYSLIEQGH